MLDMDDVLGVILGGGRGSRLYPLTLKRAKPAVPLAGRYRLIDIPISNCIHSDIDKIAILTQFQSASLNRHINRTYQRDVFSGGWVEILAAQQGFEETGWYQGTADAVRQQWLEIKSARTKYVLILAGDHLYHMDYRSFVAYHVDTGADITLAVQPVSAEDAPQYGILKRNDDGQIVDFVEKPAINELDGWESLPGTDKPYLGSMGIYVIATELLHELLHGPGNDFGKHIIPQALNERPVMGYVFEGYWADVGTMRRFYEVNLELTTRDSPLNLFDPRQFVFTRARFLPPSEVFSTHLDEVLLADGCHIDQANISKAVIGLRSVIGSNVKISSSVIMGADYYEDEVQAKDDCCPPIGIGENSTIECAIIDKNVRIGRNVHIRYVENRPDSDAENWVAREGIVIVPKSATIPDDTVI